MDTAPTRGKFGCLGCITQCVLAVLLGGVVLLAADAILIPWSFYMGGKFHLLPMWQGWGPIHASAGDYLLYVSMQPSVGRHQGVAHLKGNGILCTPRGETYKLVLGADFDKHIRTSTDGQSVYMYLHHRPGTFSRSPGDDRPKLNFYGVWHNPDMVLDDHGSLSREFLPDGTFYNGSLHTQPGAHNPLPLTLKEGTFADFESACKAAKVK